MGNNMLQIAAAASLAHDNNDIFDGVSWCVGGDYQNTFNFADDIIFKDLNILNSFDVSDSLYKFFFYFHQVYGGSPLPELSPQLIWGTNCDELRPYDAYSITDPFRLIQIMRVQENGSLLLFQLQDEVSHGLS